MRVILGEGVKYLDRRIIGENFTITIKADRVDVEEIKKGYILVLELPLFCIDRERKELYEFIKFVSKVTEFVASVELFGAPYEDICRRTFLFYTPERNFPLKEFVFFTDKILKGSFSIEADSETQEGVMLFRIYSKHK